MSRSLHLILNLVQINFDVDYKPKMRGSFLASILINLLVVANVVVVVVAINTFSSFLACYTMDEHYHIITRAGILFMINI